MTKFLQKALAGLAAIAALMGTAQAADHDWPNRPITFIVPFTPGGITDNVSRILAKILTEKLNQSVIVENRPGAGGSLGVEVASRQPPDGYTMVYGTSGTQAANLALYKNVHYDPVKDFVPVHGLAQTPLILVINPNKPFKTMPELIAYGKEHPGNFNFGSAGIGTGTHLTAELFQMATGIKMTHVPYKGSSPALTDLIAGNLDLMFDYSMVVTPFIQAGKLKPLAVTGKERVKAAPDIPTMAELGFPKAQSTAWGAIFMPAKTPSAIVKRLGDAIAQANEDPRMQEVNDKFGMIPLNLRDEKLGDFVKTEVVRWREIVQQSGAKLE